jgi:hypothetical protein
MTSARALHSRAGSLFKQIRFSVIGNKDEALHLTTLARQPFRQAA